MKNTRHVKITKIDRVARNDLAESLRHFASGLTTNFQFEDNIPESNDPAIGAVVDSVWCLYDDVTEHKLLGDDEVSWEAKKSIARWILFLHADEDYNWPKISYPGVRPMNYGVIFKLIGKHRRQLNFLHAGDFDVWPFISFESYQNALKNPKLLNRCAH